MTLRGSLDALRGQCGPLSSPPGRGQGEARRRPPMPSPPSTSPSSAAPASSSPTHLAWFPRLQTVPRHRWELDRRAGNHPRAPVLRVRPRLRSEPGPDRRAPSDSLWNLPVPGSSRLPPRTAAAPMARSPRRGVARPPQGRRRSSTWWSWRRDSPTESSPPLAADPLIRRDPDCLGAGVPSPPSTAPRRTGSRAAAPAALGTPGRLRRPAHETDLTLAPTCSRETRGQDDAAMALRALLAAEASIPPPSSTSSAAARKLSATAISAAAGTSPRRWRRGGLPGRRRRGREGFCCGPIDALAIAGSLVAAGVSHASPSSAAVPWPSSAIPGRSPRRRADPEETLAGVALLVERYDGAAAAPARRHRPPSRRGGLVAEGHLRVARARPVRQLGWAFGDVDKYADRARQPGAHRAGRQRRCANSTTRSSAGWPCSRARLRRPTCRPSRAPTGCLLFADAGPHRLGPFLPRPRARRAPRRRYRRALFLAKGSCSRPHDPDGRRHLHDRGAERVGYARRALMFGPSVPDHGRRAATCSSWRTSQDVEAAGPHDPGTGRAWRR